MEPVTVKTLEELKLVQRQRSHPTIIIEGGLANNLLISGMVRPKSVCGSSELEVPEQNVNSHLYPVYQILFELSNSNCFRVMDDKELTRIRIYPRPSARREGN